VDGASTRIEEGIISFARSTAERLERRSPLNESGAVATFMDGSSMCISDAIITRTGFAADRTDWLGTKQ
jgi:hypothetical protein